jgi:hypothetical protein
MLVLSAVAPSAHAATDETTSFYLTGYSWWDNTPPGSSTISRPVIHKKAGGTGTYSDPVTLAVGHTITDSGRDVLDYAAGTRMYIPKLRRYVIVEDSCGDGDTPQDGPCHIGHDTHDGWVPWIDVYVDGKGASKPESDACMKHIQGVTTVIMDPSPNYVVAPGPISDGECREYGQEPERVPSPSPTATSTTTAGPTGTPQLPSTTSSVPEAPPAPDATPAPGSPRSLWRDWTDILRGWWHSVTRT